MDRNITNLIQKPKFEEYLGLYNTVYPRYFSFVQWGPSYRRMEQVVHFIFFKMPFFIGIPQAILNIIVLTTVILIMKHPLLGKIS